MWVLPSRGRPHRLYYLVTACLATGMTTPVLVRADDDDPALPGYLALALPKGWDVVSAPRTGLAALYNNAFRAQPDADWYGFLADDVAPLSPEWDRVLIEASGLDGMAVPAGGETTGGTPHFVLGGNLVRSMGWLALPGLDRLYIDTAWALIAKARGVYRERPDVRLEHRHFSNGKALFDATYRKPNKVKDKEIFTNWKRQEGYP